MYTQKYKGSFFSFRKCPFILFCILFSGMSIPMILLGAEPDLAAGDSAFAAKDYAVAASFYTRHLDKLKKAPGDPVKLREGYERLMDSLLFSNLTSDAEKYLAEYKKRFPNANRISVDMWQGELLLQKGLFSRAEALYEKLISALHGRDPRRLRALSAYARTLENLKRYQDAAKAYAMLRERAGESFMGRKAFIHETLNTIHAKDYVQAEKLIADAKKLPEKGIRIHELLSLYFSLKKNGITASRKIFLDYLAGQEKNLSDRSEAMRINRKDPLLYLVASAYGDAFAAAGDLSSAVLSYRLAYKKASNNKELFQTLSNLIKVVEMGGDGIKAAELARKQVEFFRHPLVNTGAKLRIAHTLGKNGKDKEAIQLYESVFYDLNATKEQKNESCKKYLLLMIRNKKSAEGMSVLRKTFQNKNMLQEGEMLIADTLKEAGLLDECIAAYENLGSSHPASAITENALYKALRIAVLAGKRTPAEKLYPKLLSANPSSPEIKRELPFLEGMKNKISGREKEAEKALKKYIDTLPAKALKDLPEALKVYALLALEKKEYKKAVPALQRLVKEFPLDQASPLAFYWLLHIYFLRNDELSAEQTAWHLAGQYPSSPLVPEALLHLSRHYTDNREFNKAASCLERLSRLPSFKNASEALKGKLLLEKSHLALQQGEKEEALNYLQETVKTVAAGPIYQKAGCKMGEVLYAMNRVDDAIEAYTKASVAAGSDPLLTFAAQGALGNILLLSRAQDPESLKHALACFQAIANENSAPDEFRAEARYKAGRCHELLGEKEEAELLYKQLLYTYPAKKFLKNPAVSHWCVKAAESLIDSAAKTPVLSAFENARNALHYLHDANLISKKDAQNRFEALKQMKFNP